MKEFWKSVNIWGSYGQEFSVWFCDGVEPFSAPNKWSWYAGSLVVSQRVMDRQKDGRIVALYDALLCSENNNCILTTGRLRWRHRGLLMTQTMTSCRWDRGRLQQLAASSWKRSLWQPPHSVSATVSSSWRHRLMGSSCHPTSPALQSVQ